MSSRRLPFLVGLAALTVTARVAAGIGHVLAHAWLRMGLPAIDAVLVVAATGAGIFGAWQAVKGHPEIAAGLLSFAGLLGILHGLYAHFLNPGPDLVANVPHGPAGALFVSTAFLLLVLDLLLPGQAAVLAWNKPKVQISE